MSLFGRMMARVFGRAAARRRIRASFDASKTTDENRNHWANADDYSAASSITPAVRRQLRRRARYERDNDPNLNGLMKTLAYDFIGTGPRLQLLLGEENHQAASEVEASFAAWCRATGLSEKLRVMHEARPVDGESFGLFTTNPAVRHPVKLDVRPLESEQVETPTFDRSEADGIEFDAAGNPTYYHVLREHPGDNGGLATGEYERIPARLMVHWFRPTRPGQTRGACEIASSLPIGAQTRRYSSAVLTAAEIAAMLAGVLELPAPLDPTGNQAPEYDAMDTVSLVRGTMITVPPGSKPTQFKPEHPTTTHKEFVDLKRNEMARPVLAPFNVISGNSSGYNYSSGRLDHVPYHRAIWIERERFRAMVLDKLFLVWISEANSLGLIPDSLPPISAWSWDWHWDGFLSIDPFKDARAVELRLQLNLTTLSEECAAEGKNWRDVIDQRAIERAYMASKGINPEASARPANPAQQNIDPALQDFIDQQNFEDTANVQAG